MTKTTVLDTVAAIKPVNPEYAALVASAMQDAKKEPNQPKVFDFDALKNRIAK